MLCHRCHMPVEEGEQREHGGEVLCEDCYMDVLSPPRKCDPWAVYTARGLKDHAVSWVGNKILERIRTQPWPSFEELLETTGVDPHSLEREIAALRHAELLKAVILPGGKKGFAPFDA